jgi:siroheme synthase (precorrin-2 oxidase/ferrochelatase)
MSLLALKEIISEVDFLQGELKENSIPIDIRNEEVTAKDLIDYAMEHEHLLEQVITLARKCNKLGIKL